MCDRTRRRLETEAGRPQRETITAEEAAAIIGVSAWKVYDLARRGLIPSIAIGRRRLFRRSSILAHLDELERQSLAARQKR